MRTKSTAAWVAVLSLTVVALLLSGTETSMFGSCPAGRFEGQYYRNADLRGKPIPRCEKSKLDEDWGEGGPLRPAGGSGDGKADSFDMEEFVGRDNFSVRWTGRFKFNSARYTFRARADDGVRVWVDDVLIIDEWRDQPVSEFSKDLDLTRGEHTVKVEYYERTGGALVAVSWTPTSS